LVVYSILAIHGLNGNPINTWTEPKSHKLWFRDFLPRDVPNARIMTFGYDATAAFERSTAGILEHARDLLRYLDEARTDVEERNRPILFVVHSLGGLVLKQALVIAAESGLRQYEPIWEATKGVIFFGTPHRGSSLAKYGAQLARVPTALSMKPTPRLLESLRTGSFVLSQLNDSFSGLMDRRGQQEGKEVVSFYETKSMLGWTGLVVEQSSALINSLDSHTQWETPIPVNATHRDMCRFSSSDNSTYVTAVHSIRRLRSGNSELDIVTNEFFQVPTTLNTYFTGRKDIRSRMKEELVAEKYAVEKKQKRFVLFGMGGSGKTQISLKFAHDHRKRHYLPSRIRNSTDKLLGFGRYSSSMPRAIQLRPRGFNRSDER
jgi:pimeloyl-ACP methyl ester carboxylesterase